MKCLFFLLFALVHLETFAQSGMEIKLPNGEKFDQTHINWNFSIGKLDDTKYVLEAIAMIEDGWHIFSSNPGGDGSLTPTQIEVNELKKFKTPVEFSENEGWIEKDMEGIGSVRYFEKQAIFKIIFAAPANIKTFTGSISFQTCNEVMCMAPTSKSFSVTIKK